MCYKFVKLTVYCFYYSQKHHKKHTVDGRTNCKKLILTAEEIERNQFESITDFERNKPFKSYGCGGCNRRFVHRDMAKQHLQLQHVDEHQCNYDSFVTRNQEDMDAHLFVRHPQELSTDDYDRIEKRAIIISREAATKRVKSYVQNTTKKNITESYKKQIHDKIDKKFKENPNLLDRFCIAEEEDYLARNLAKTKHYRDIKQRQLEAIDAYLDADLKQRKEARKLGRSRPFKPAPLNVKRYTYGKIPKDYWKHDHVSLELVHDAATSDTESFITDTKRKTTRKENVDPNQRKKRKLVKSSRDGRPGQT